jgi:transcriptional regulator with XRE-family HTH domain
MRLRDVRLAHGWSQARLVHEIVARLKAAGRLNVSPESLKVYVSEWENGRRPVAPMYREVLRAIFGMTDEELFGTDEAEIPVAAPGHAELLDRIAGARAIDRAAVATLAAQTDLFRTMDRQLGAGALVDQIRGHLLTLEKALTHAVLPDARRPVACVLSETATLAGWQALDVGAADRAWDHYEKARTAATESARPALVAHAMGEQAYVLADVGRPTLGAQLLDEAIAVATGHAPARLLTWLHAAQAELYALACAADASRSALDRAAASLPDDSEDRDPDVPGVILNETHLMRWRGHALALLGEPSAVEQLYAALDRMDGTFTRARAGLLCDLAHAHRVRGELDDAQRQARAARLLANRTGSVRHLRRIDRLALSE